MKANRNMKAVMDILEQRRSQAAYQAEKKKEELFAKNPRLSEIEREIAAAGMMLFENQIKGMSQDKAQEVYAHRIEQLEKEQQELFSRQGLSDIDLEPQYTCQSCRDTGFVNGEKCRCLKTLIADMFLADFDLTSKVKEACFDVFDCSVFSEEYQSRAKKTKIFGQRYCENFENEGNYIFTGKAGRGKTFLCSCIAVELIESGWQVIYITAAHLANLVRDHAYAERRDEAEGLYESLNACDLLIIDDFGAEYQTDFAQCALYDIINTRLMKDKKLIISTNLNMEEMAEQYDVRLSSRLRGNFKQLTFPWEDIRVKKTK